MSVYSRLIPFVLFVPFWAYLVWAWLRQIKTEQGNAPKWRVGVAWFGLVAATASTLLSAFLFLHAVVTGGYPFYHPVELFCIGVGSLTALLGIVAAIAGKGKVDGHVAVISTLNLLLWLIDAVGQ